MEDGTGSDTENTRRTSQRSRKPTEKGVWWQIETLQNNFRRAVSAWRSKCNSVTILLSDSKNVEEIRGSRYALVECMCEITSIYNHIKRLITESESIVQEHSDLIRDIEQEVTQKYETYEAENSKIVTDISYRIRDLEDEKSERSSKRSARSRSMRSHVSSRHSNVSHRSDTAMKAAELKTKLKYMGLEAKAQLELDKIRTIRELESTEAKLEVLDKETSGSVLDEAKRSLPNLDVIGKYLDQTENVLNIHENVPEATDAKTINHQHNVEPVDSSHEKIDRLSVDLNPDATVFVPEFQKQSFTAETSQNITHITSSKKPIYDKPIVSDNVTLAASHQQFSSSDVTDLAKSFAEQVSLSRLPPPEPPIFNGDPLRYPAWKASFQTLIEQRRIPALERIHYLRRYVGDSVREVIENFFLVTSDDAYSDAKALLDKRYGDPFVISNAFRERLESWPKIASRDCIGLRKFSDFLKQCLSAMNSMKTLNVLNDDRENRKLLAKLPDWIVTRWGRVVTTYKKDNSEFPSFKIFCDFIDQESTIANDPVTSLNSIKTEPSNITPNSSKIVDSKYSNRNTSRNSKPFTQRRNVLATTQTENSKVNNCVVCNKEHNINSCKQFLENSVVDRKELAKRKGLCFGCLGTGHLSKLCGKRATCSICSKRHPTALHGDRIKVETPEPNIDNKETVSSQTGAVFLNHGISGNKCSMIVPVFVSHSENPSEERLVYALLDTQSDTTFILENTRQALGLSGTDVKLSLSTMHAESAIVDSCKLKGLIVRGYNSDLKIHLPTVYSRHIMPANKSHIPTADMARRWPDLACIADKLMPVRDIEFGLLIGYNCARALTPREVIPTTNNGPYAQRTDLGWGIVGIVDPSYVDDNSVGYSHRTVSIEVEIDSKTVHYCTKGRVKELTPIEVNGLLEQDFSDRHVNRPSLSIDDRKFLDILSKGIKKVEGHYEMPLPFKDSDPVLPNNKSLAIQRLECLQRRFRKDVRYRNDYFKNMNDFISRGYAEKVNPSNADNIWYIPHHGVYHPQKPDKVRVVFDCSAKFKGESLNDYLLQGPDLTNSLLGVLCRFRQEQIAIVCDIEQMFLQFRVKSEHRNYLRFLWWDDNDTTKDPCEYRMNVHLFGAASSPGCANFGLKQIANDNEHLYGTEIADFIRKDFYVDDGLKSVSSVDSAVNLIEGSKQLCKEGGLRLHKFCSNSKEVLKQIPTEDRANDVANIDLLVDKLPSTKTLGVQWCIESDTFQFRIVLNNKPLTRRGVLSVLSSVYDPLGFISPVILIGKRILQECCSDGHEWDDPLPDNIVQRWDHWRKDIQNLATLNIPRCVKPDDFGRISTCEIHHFSDASTLGYGQCSYIRLIDENERTHCSLLMSKSKVVPRKPITIPRLELSAAVTSVKTSAILTQELEYENITEWFWTDSNIVLGYISNESRRFHVFVSNRIQQIRDRTNPEQWKFIDTKQNPADIASRGVFAEELMSSDLWFKGPKFLWTSKSFGIDDKKPNLDPSDPEVKKVSVHSTKASTKYDSILDRINYFSDWNKAKRAIAVCLKLRDYLRMKSKTKPESVFPLTVEDMRRAECEIIKQVQSEAFKEELETLQSCRSENSDSNDRNFVRTRNSTMKQKSSLYKLDPFLDEYEILRVGGRIRHASFSDNLRHPVILPKHSHVTDLVVRHFHARAQHQGRGITMNLIRSNGYWIINCNSIVSNHISKCVICRKLRSSAQVQKMADLPSDRLQCAPPFTYCGVDLFGPFLIKEGRREIKRYGVLFTCLSSRAIHLETCNSLETSSFINALRRFIAIRGPIRQLRCDQGTNFVGAEREFQNELSGMNLDQICQFLRGESCDFIQFKMNVPSASHMGGVWERQIRSVRNILATLLYQQGTQLDDESLRTLMSEAAAIVNSRPLTVNNLNDPVSLEPLTPNHLLTMKSNILLPPPGQFLRNDIYSRKRWRRVQFLANEFWNRWRKEFLSSLQSRQKWTAPKRNMCVGDIVIVKDDNAPRNLWRLGRILETYPESDGFVRKVRLSVGTLNLDRNGVRKSKLSELERPIHKLILLKETEDVPADEP